MDHLPVNINLLSYPPGGSGRTTTLQEITEAGIGDLFDKIVFTMHRTAAEHQAIATEHARPQLEQYSSGAVEYEVYTGGKDDYIRTYDQNLLTFFVDDKITTIEAVLRAVPHTRAYEFRRHRFYSHSAAITHISKLRDLSVSIENALLQSRRFL